MQRVTAYCRVSTDRDDQINSLENQERYFKDYIKANTNWEYVPLYADEGLSGTSTKKRKRFNQMIFDAELGKFDLILTKEVSRFARNTVDTLNYTRSLKENGIGVIFLSDNINTLDADGELRLTIMAGIAQEESRKTSERVKWGQRRSMENGVVFGNTVLGYTIKGGRLEINHNQADTVKKIFNKYLYESKGLSKIAKELEQEGILTSYGNRRWEATAVLRILTNEKYCGDLKQRKYYTPNYLTHEIRRNRGEEDFIIIKDNHEAIISRDVFEQTQKEVKRRGVSVKTRYSNRYAFSGKLRCGICGSSFVSRNRKSNDGSRDIRRWQCGKYFKYGDRANGEGGCEKTLIRNEVLEMGFQKALQDATDNKDSIVDECVKLVSDILGENQLQNDYEDYKNTLKRLTERKNKLIDLHLDGILTKELLIEKISEIDLQISALQKCLSQIDGKVTHLEEANILISRIRKHIEDIVYSRIFSDEVVRETLDKIVIYGKDEYDIYLY